MIRPPPPLSRRAALLALATAALPLRAQAAAGRVVSLGGAVTETVFALGAGGRLVATDLTSDYPPAAAKLPRVGYVRAIGAEGVLSLAPDLVLATSDAGPPAAMQQIAAAKVAMVTLPEAHTPPDALERIRRIGTALDRTDETQTLLAAIRADLAQVQADLAGVAPKPAVLFLLSAGRGAPMASGHGTAADAMIRLAGGTNAVAGFAQYRPLSHEALLLAAPSLVVTTSQTLEAAGGEAGLRAALPGLDPAVRVAAFDGLYLLGFGPRLAQAQRDLAALLHPGLALRPLPPRPWAA